MMPTPAVNQHIHRILTNRHAHFSDSAPSYLQADIRASNDWCSTSRSTCSIIYHNIRNTDLAAASCNLSP
jgi:hypothetical protein